MVHGIDVSSHQSDSYDTDGLAFVIVKATEGRTYVNPKMEAQARRAREAGLVVGFYHFLWPGDVEEQAEHFVDTAPAEPGDLLACDWETTSNGTWAGNGEKDRFIRTVKELTPRNRVLLYCNRAFWLTKDRTSYAGDGLWIADYGAARGKPAVTAEWTFHQYTDDPVDRNVSRFGSADALREWARGA